METKNSSLMLRFRAIKAVLVFQAASFLSNKNMLKCATTKLRIF